MFRIGDFVVGQRLGFGKRLGRFYVYEKSLFWYLVLYIYITKIDRFCFDKNCWILDSCLSDIGQT